jgi:hypothetical protein
MSLKGPEDGIKEENYNTEKMIRHVLEKINGLEQPRIRNEIISYYKNEIQQSISKKLQLWSDSSKNEYAIRVKGEPNILAATNESQLIEYTVLVEEADYLEDMRYDWGYTLKHWTSNRFHNDKDRVNTVR